MFSQHEINEEEHLAWYENHKANPLKVLNVYEDAGEIKGFLQLQKESPENNVFEWGFYISPEAIQGTGTKMAQLALNKVFIEMQGVKVFGEVLAFNLPSIKLHKRLGFNQEGFLRQHHFLNGQYYDVNCFGLLKSEWIAMQQKKELDKK
jgi:RimJ/RimL family protein N-acetyltransferase